MTRRPSSMTLRRLVSLGAVAVCCACASPSVSERTGSTFGLVVTQVADEGPVASLAVDPATRYPVGSRIIWVPSIERPDDYQVLSAGLAAAGSPDLAPDAKTVVFSGRERETDNWAIFESRIPRGKPTKIVGIEGDCIDPAYLAGSRIVFACSAAGDADSGGKGGFGWSLFTADGDGSEVERISFGPGDAFGPTALLDGRVLFSMRQGPGWGRPADSATALFTSNSDGTLLEAFTGSHSSPALKMRPRQDGGKVMFIGKEQGGTSARIQLVEMGRPISSRKAISVSLTPFSVEPLGDSTLLIASPGYRGGEGPQPAGVFRWQPDDPNPHLIFHQPGWREIEALSSEPTPTPKNLPSPVDPDAQEGVLLCYDASRTEIEDHSSTVSAPADVVVLRTWTADGESPSELGRALVESDGSFSLSVPADIPLRVTTLTSDGTELAASDWFWVRPGEVRACFGCHESRERAPVNRPVLALSHPVRTLIAPDEAALR